MKERLRKTAYRWWICIIITIVVSVIGAWTCTLKSLHSFFLWRRAGHVTLFPEKVWVLWYSGSVNVEVNQHICKSAIRRNCISLPFFLKELLKKPGRGTASARTSQGNGMEPVHRKSPSFKCKFRPRAVPLSTHLHWLKVYARFVVSAHTTNWDHVMHTCKCLYSYGRWGYPLASTQHQEFKRWRTKHQEFRVMNITACEIIYVLKNVDHINLFSRYDYQEYEIKQPWEPRMWKKK